MPELLPQYSPTEADKQWLSGMIGMSKPEAFIVFKDIGMVYQKAADNKLLFVEQLDLVGADQQKNQYIAEQQALTRHRTCYVAKAIGWSVVDQYADDLRARGDDV